MMERIVNEKLTVRELDKAIKELKNGGASEEEGTNVEIGNSIPAVASITPVLDDAPKNLSAADIVGEDKPDSGSSLISNDNNALPSFNNEETTEPATDPTVVDINQIRENSVDIGGTNIFTANTTEPPTEATTEEKKDDSFKFVPTITFNGANNSNSTEPEKPTEIPVNRFSGFFNTNVGNSTEPVQNNNVASTIAPVGLTVTTNNSSNDVNVAKDDIKNVIDSLKEKGYNVTFEEVDGITEYKITISLQK
jgi:hypothetical protein